MLKFTGWSHLHLACLLVIHGHNHALIKYACFSTCSLLVTSTLLNHQCMHMLNTYSFRTRFAKSGKHRSSLKCVAVDNEQYAQLVHGQSQLKVTSQVKYCMGLHKGLTSWVCVCTSVDMTSLCYLTDCYNTNGVGILG